MSTAFADHRVQANAQLRFSKADIIPQALLIILLTKMKKDFLFELRKRAINERARYHKKQG